jgi:hypothetical protein
VLAGFLWQEQKNLCMQEKVNLNLQVVQLSITEENKGKKSKNLKVNNRTY